MRLSRREFVQQLGVLGGVGAAHVAMQALGLAPMPVPYMGPSSLPPQSGKGSKIVILGAGVEVTGVQTDKNSTGTIEIKKQNATGMNARMA